MITITDARITADLRDATVFYTVLGDSAAQAGTAAALESAKGLLRSTVGKALGLRHSPTLTFVLDDVQDQAKHIDELLAAARDADAEVQRLAAGARYAGDAQPYRVPPDGDALGSMLAFGLGLRRRGHTAVQASVPGLAAGAADVPEPFAWLPGLDL